MFARKQLVKTNSFVIAPAFTMRCLDGQVGRMRQRRCHGFLDPLQKTPCRSAGDRGEGAHPPNLPQPHPPSARARRANSAPASHFRSVPKTVSLKTPIPKQITTASHVAALSTPPPLGPVYFPFRHLCIRIDMLRASGADQTQFPYSSICTF